MKVKDVLKGIPALPNSDRERALLVDKIAERYYRGQFGKRPVTVYLCKRSQANARKHRNFVFTPSLWKYIIRYPRNEVVFITVDLKTGMATVDGVLMHFQAQHRAYPVGRGMAIKESDIIKPRG